jgi:hypothetical protein
MQERGLVVLAARTAREMEQAGAPTVALAPDHNAHKSAHPALALRHKQDNSTIHEAMPPAIHVHNACRNAHHHGFRSRTAGIASDAPLSENLSPKSSNPGLIGNLPQIPKPDRCHRNLA